MINLDLGSWLDILYSFQKKAFRHLFCYKNVKFWRKPSNVFDFLKISQKMFLEWSKILMKNSYENLKMKFLWKHNTSFCKTSSLYFTLLNSKSLGQRTFKVGFHTTDFIAIAQKAQELFVSACVEWLKYRCTRDFWFGWTAFWLTKKVELVLLLLSLWETVLTTNHIQEKRFPLFVFSLCVDGAFRDKKILWKSNVATAQKAPEPFAL